MQTIETTGKSVKDATDAAAKQLGAPANQLKVTVLEEHKGLFGKANVRIRAELVIEEAAVAVSEPEPQPEPEPEPEVHAAPNGVVEAEAHHEEKVEDREGHTHPDATEEDGKKILGL